MSKQLLHNAYQVTAYMTTVINGKFIVWQWPSPNLVQIVSLGDLWVMSWFGSAMPGLHSIRINPPELDNSLFPTYIVTAQDISYTLTHPMLRSVEAAVKWSPGLEQ